MIRAATRPQADCETSRTFPSRISVVFDERSVNDASASSCLQAVSFFLWAKSHEPPDQKSEAYNEENSERLKCNPLVTGNVF
jgi:hypothetical protein